MELELKKDLATRESKRHPLEAELLSIEKVLAGHDYATIKSKLDAVEKEISKIQGRLNEISKEIDNIKTEIMNNCRVLAATATQSYLKPEKFKLFDVVIIDESSMLLLPLVTYVAGLAKEKVTVTGDFRQLPLP